MAIIQSVAIGVSVLVLVILVYMAAMRSKHHYTSALTCPKCERTFDYHWVPLASFNAVRLGRERYLECPLCREWSTFNIWDTRKRPEPA